MNVSVVSASLLGMEPWIVWTIVMIVTLGAELLSVNMTTIWFSAGALVALIVSFVTDSLLIQAAVFVIVSLLGLALFIAVVKPRLSRRLSGAQATNADRIVGKVGLVTTKIDPLKATGQILVLGQTWSARSLDEEVIDVGTHVDVVKLESVYAIVRRCPTGTR